MIRVISKKIIKDQSHIIKINNYMMNLTNKAKLNKGYISSYHFWEYHELQDKMKYNLFTISDWKNIDNWNNWLSSEDRYLIHNKNIDFIESLNHTVLIKKNDTFIDFLL